MTDEPTGIHDLPTWRHATELMMELGSLVATYSDDNPESEGEPPDEQLKNARRRMEELGDLHKVILIEQTHLYATEPAQAQQQQQRLDQIGAEWALGMATTHDFLLEHDDAYRREHEANDD